ncbi:MAG: elongation factor P maturation arginine rhamnosyltransferase EarP [Treponema sp.]|nr:elongation factor P maturation arginine rhamnosyltransferase EarP [Treponema sp.]
MRALTVLCKVVDNFGDIGFVYRLSKNLCKVNPDCDIRIITNDVGTFLKLAPELGGKTKKGAANEKCSQAQEGAARIRLFDSNAADLCRAEFTTNPPRVILECFQCGRPDWLEEILFGGETGNGVKTETAGATEIEGKTKKAPPASVLIINIDYLTAEPYAEEFHKLKSGTRSASVKKYFFMPGFTAKTGGLILDEPEIETDGKTKTGAAGIDGKTTTAGPQILMFSYPKNFAPIIRAILRWNPNAQINLAQGAGKESFLQAASCFNLANNYGKTTTAGGLRICELPFFSQQDWDKNLYASDLLFVRGEDSLTRACLSAKPFVWQAYLQDDNYQLVKVRALLDRMRPHFDPSDFAALQNFWLLYNDADLTGSSDYEQKMEAACHEFLTRYNSLRAGFESFARSLRDLGNFTKKLLDFVAEMESSL